MKILIDADVLSSKTNGISIYSKNIIDKLTISGYDINFIVTDYNLYNELKNQHLNVLFINSLLLKAFRKKLFKIFLLHFYIPKKITYSYYISFDYFVPIFLDRNIRVISFIYDLSFKLFPSTMTFYLRWGLRIFLPFTITKSHKIFTISQSVKKELVKYYSNINVGILYPIISPFFFEKNKQKLLIDHDYILSVGTLEPRKNYINNIKAFNKISNFYPNLKYVIVGNKGWKNKKILELIRSNKNIIHFHGLDIDSIKNLYENSMIVLLTSKYEGFGMPVLESILQNRRLILSPISVFKEIIDLTNYKNFFFTKSINHQDIFNAIMHVLNTPRVAKNLIEKPNLNKLNQSLPTKQLVQILFNE